MILWYNTNFAVRLYIYTWFLSMRCKEITPIPTASMVANPLSIFISFYQFLVGMVYFLESKLSINDSDEISQYQRENSQLTNEFIAPNFGMWKQILLLKLNFFIHGLIGVSNLWSERLHLWKKSKITFSNMRDQHIHYPRHWYKLPCVFQLNK